MILFDCARACYPCHARQPTKKGQTLWGLKIESRAVLTVLGEQALS
jgi:hypothetical protein